MNNFREKIKGFKWYWKLLLAIPATFIGLLIIGIIKFLFKGTIDLSFYEYLRGETLEDYFPFLIILIFVNFILHKKTR